MDYMLMFYQPTDDFEMRSDPARSAAYNAGWRASGQAVSAAGIVKSGDGLQPPSTATTLRIGDGKRRVQDGPFAESKEQLGGYFVIDVPDLDTALAWAARAPCAATGGVEVRPTLPRQAN